MEAKNHKVLEKALHMMELIAKYSHGGTLTEICTELDISKSTAHGLLTTFVNMGYLSREKDGGRFFVGIKAFELGTSFVENNGLYKYSREVLEELVAKTGETAHAAILEGTDVVYINKFDCSHAVRMISHIGKRVPAHATAIGKAMLSGKTNEELLQLYPNGKLEKLTANTIKDLSTLIEQLEEVRTSGYATEREESTAGIRCVAVSVENSSGAVVMGISISVPVSRSGKSMKRFLKPLEEAKLKIKAIV